MYAVNVGLSRLSSSFAVPLVPLTCKECRNDLSDASGKLCRAKSQAFHWLLCSAISAVPPCNPLRVLIVMSVLVPRQGCNATWRTPPVREKPEVGAERSEGSVAEAARSCGIPPLVAGCRFPAAFPPKGGNGGGSGAPGPFGPPRLPEPCDAREGVTG